jgi:hypothetical protein
MASIVSGCRVAVGVKVCEGVALGGTGEGVTVRLGSGRRVSVRIGSVESLFLPEAAQAARKKINRALNPEKSELNFFMGKSDLQRLPISIVFSTE